MIDDDWDGTPVTGWVWNLRKNGVEFIRDLQRYPNGAIEFEPAKLYRHYGELEEAQGSVCWVREVFETEADAVKALIAFLGRRIDRATRLKAKLERQLAALAAPIGEVPHA